MFHPVFLFLNIGTPELMLILFVALLLFGGEKLPQMARTLGKGIRDFKDASEGVKREIQNQINNLEEKAEPKVAATTPEEDHAVSSIPNSVPIQGASYIGITDHETATESHADVSHLITEHSETTPETENHAYVSNVNHEHTETPEQEIKVTKE